MSIPDIANLEDLLSDLLDDNKNHVNIERRRITAPGENYGSLIIAIKITIQEDEKEIVHNLVAKIVPANDFIKEFMKVPYTFRNEFEFYNTILPCLRQFQNEQGSSKSLDFFSKFYGGRLSLDPTTKYADDDAVILLENLKEEGFVMVEKDASFDLATSKLVLEKIAEMHAAALALKTVRPDVFQEKILPFLEEFEMFNSDDNVVGSEKSINTAVLMVEDDELCSLYKDRIKETITECCKKIKMPKNSSVFREGVFSTFIHGDLWINNIMVKVYNSKITNVKLLDLQLFEYNSVTKDVLFFIFTCVQTSLLKNYIDDLICFYFKKLTENLKELQCDTGKFTFEEFMEEMKNTVKTQEYYHILGVFFLIYAKEQIVWDVDEIDQDKFYQQIVASEEVKKKASLMTREFIQRGWL